MIGFFALLGGCASNSDFNQWDARSHTKAGMTMVRPGDTLYSIAMAHDLDWRDVAQWNGIRDPRTLRAGQTLRLTAPVGRRAPVSAPILSHHAPTPVPAAPHPTRPPIPHHTTATRGAGDGQLHWRWPVRGGKVVSRFIDDSNLQKGLIISGVLNEPIYASTGGEVVYAGNGLPGYGNLLIIKYNGSWLSAYGYNRKLLVKEGQHVTAGQRVALMGRRDGRALDKTGSLLFQIRRDGKPVDPLRYLPQR